MKDTLLISHVTMINPEGKPFEGDLFIQDGEIAQIGCNLNIEAAHYIDGTDQDWLLLPGYIDMHIHGSAVP
ncbi:hypothetical protein AABM34_17420 [Lysinibacillus fusiformis]